MNVVAIKSLADLLENIPAESHQGFNMGCFYCHVLYALTTNVEHTCGAVACVAGWAATHIDGNGSVLTQPRTRKEIEATYRQPGSFESIEYILATRLLSLTRDEAEALFLPMENEDLRVTLAEKYDLDEDVGFNWSDVKPQQAAKVLRKLAAIGRVDWTEAFI